MEKATRKEIISLILAMVMFVLSACGAVSRAKEAEKSTETIAVETVEETTEETTEATEETTEETEPETEATTEATEATTEATEATEPEPNATIVNVNSYVNVRAEKSVSSTKVGTYAKGDRVYIETVETSGGTRWGKTEMGWVSMDYVKLDGDTTTATEATKTAESTKATEATTAPTEAQNVNNTPKATEATTPATEATQPATQATTTPTEAATQPATTAPTEAATEATTQPTVAETEPVVTECSHNWVTETTEEVGHYEYYEECACSANVGDSAGFIAHCNQYDNLTALTYHGGYHSASRWVVDTPASSRTYCTICGATK